MSDFIPTDVIVLGDAREQMARIRPGSVACSIWSPPYHVGKQYEDGMSLDEWKSLLREVIALHAIVLKPGGFMVINIADKLCFKDPSMPRIMAENVARKRADITREMVAAAWAAHPDYNRYQIAELLGCSEQTVQRRIEGNNVRGGKYATQTRVFLVGGLLEEMGLRSSLYLYDRRIWVKDAAWENSRWHSLSYRAVDEFEYIYIFWKPGPILYDRSKLTREEWVEWGSRGVWHIPSVRANDRHEAMFPLELPTRVIRLLTEPGDLVLDPFVGSGTTAVAAINTGRRFLGIDKEAKYVEMAKKAAADAQRQLLPTEERLRLPQAPGSRPARQLRIGAVDEYGRLPLQPVD